MKELTVVEATQVNGGFVCGGLCVIGAISAGIGFMTAGISIGAAVAKATN
ncbi:hypothetical protein [Microbulbifer sediminum]|nr:hypothetical protein [Microbulbifer sediminum]